MRVNGNWPNSDTKVVNACVALRTYIAPSSTIARTLVFNHSNGAVQNTSISVRWDMQLVSYDSGQVKKWMNLHIMSENALKLSYFQNFE